jgi:hypothetical protein
VVLRNIALGDQAVGACHAELQARLVEAVRSAIPMAEQVGEVIARSQLAYREVGEILVELRHEVRCADGRPDIRGRSPAYRTIVREAYAEAGALHDGPIEKRLTAGVAYWVRKILTEQYGDSKLREMGVIRAPAVVPRTESGLRGFPKDPMECLNLVIGLLNTLATDPRVVPTEELVLSATRAVILLRRKLEAITNAA